MQRRLLVAWLWPSLALGVLWALWFFIIGVDWEQSWVAPFAVGEFFVAGVPVGVVHGVIVFGLLVMVWRLTRDHIRMRVQPLFYGVVGFLLSWGTLFGLLSLFRVSFSPLLFSLITGLVFGIVYYAQFRRRG